MTPLVGVVMSIVENTAVDSQQSTVLAPILMLRVAKSILWQQLMYHYISASGSNYAHCSYRFKWRVDINWISMAAHKLNIFLHS